MQLHTATLLRDKTIDWRLRKYAFDVFRQINGNLKGKHRDVICQVSSGAQWPTPYTAGWYQSPSSLCPCSSVSRMMFVWVTSNFNSSYCMMKPYIKDGKCTALNFILEHIIIS